MKTQSVDEQMKQPRPRGFTLTEILVVITIILVLAILSVSVTSRMRNSAERVVSTRNISQLQLANASYAADHNGKYVPLLVSNSDGAGVSGSAYWMANQEFIRNLRGEVGREWDTTVPLSMLDPVTVRARKTSYTQLDSSYGYNNTKMPDAGAPGGTWMGNDANPSFRVSQVVNPSLSACFITGTDFIISHGSRFRWKDAPVEGRTTNQKMAYRYNKKALVVYYDGHVGEVSMADIAAIDDKGGIENAFWNAGSTR